MSFQQQLKSWSRGNQLIAAGSIVVLISMFLPWYGASFSGTNVNGLGTIGGFSTSVNGFHSWGWLTFIGLLALVAFWGIRNFAGNSVQLPAMPVKDGYILLGLAAVELIGVLLFLVTNGGYDVSGSGPGYSVGIQWGFFVGLVGVIVTAVGAFLMRDTAGAAVSTPQYAVPGGYNTYNAPGAPYQAPQQPSDYTPPPPPAP